MTQRTPSDDSAAPIGVLFVNLGTPDSPRVRDVRRYLRQFLSDRRVVDTPRILWWPLLNGIILPIRAKKSAHAYAQVWTSEGSPLLAISRKQAASLARELGPRYRVELAMRYGNPSIEAGLRALAAAGCARIRVLTAFPQYSDSTVGSVVAEVERVARAQGWPAPEPDDHRADATASAARENVSAERGNSAAQRDDAAARRESARAQRDNAPAQHADSTVHANSTAQHDSKAQHPPGPARRDSAPTPPISAQSSSPPPAAPSPRIDFVPPWFDDAGYVRALAETCRAHETQRARANPSASPIRHWVFSFHGLPKRYVDRGDPYRRHCEATARALASAMGLQVTEWTTTFQSRFGPEPWLQPYTDVLAPELVKQHGCVAIAMPGFLADCLETIEEIGLRLVEDCQPHGELVVVPCVNDAPVLSTAMAQLARATGRATSG